MADVRCPMCGKTNPTDQTVCKFCGARLRPVWESGEDQASNTDLPDWLAGLGGASGQTPQPEENIPDWLSGLRGEPGGSVDPESPAELARPEEAKPQDADTSGWLKNIFTESSFASEEESAARPLDELPEDSGDWLSRIGASEGAESPAWPDEGDTGLPDWLRSSPSAPPEKPAGPAETEPMDWGARQGEETPDWLKGMADESPAEEPEAPSEDELPDWLRSASAEPPAVSQPQPEAQDLSTPDWLKGMASETGEPAETEAGKTADWMAAAGGDELPDWLRSASGETSEASQPQGDAQEFSTLDWLSQMSAETGAPAEFSAPVERMPSAAGDELPDWLSSAPETADGGPHEFAAPDWLSQSAAPEGEAQPAGEENGMLSWLAAMENETPEQSPASSAVEEASSGSDLSWLDELESTYSGLSVESDQPTSDRDALTVGANIDEGSQIEQGSLPGWLMGAGFEEEAQPEADQGAEDDSLKVEALPSWLQAMRPVGASSSMDTESPGEVSSQPMEGAGPLAGLRGVLPAEPDISQVDRPPVYSVRLQVTEAQEVQAKMLADLLEAEVQPRAVPARPVLTSRTLLRVAIALVLILALLPPILTGLPAFLPPVVPGEVSGVYNQIDTLPAGARVLLAVDYDPSFSAEMDAITGAALTHLLYRGAVPVMVSTTATGPMQAERLLVSVGLTANRSLAVTQDYINLGIIPGGAAGLASFIQSPITAQTVDLTGLPAINTPALQGVDSLAGFSLILVATESPDRARAWIEQIQSQPVSQAGQPPLVMLVSAQAEPLVRPYYDASPRQVQGLVTGLSGALAYETAAGQRGQAAQFWSPFNLGLAVAALLMLLGGIFNLIARRLPAKRGPQEGEPV